MITSFLRSCIRHLRWWLPVTAKTRIKMLITLTELQRKLAEQRKETEQWRKRCLKVEDLYACQVRAMRTAAQDHEGLSWRIL